MLHFDLQPLDVSETVGVYTAVVLYPQQLVILLIQIDWWCTLFSTEVYTLALGCGGRIVEFQKIRK